MSAAYEAWGVERRQPKLLGLGAAKGDCDRILRLHEGAGLVVRSGVVIAVKTGTAPAAKASLQRAAFAAYRERGDLPAPEETDRDRERIARAEAERERQRAALRLAPPPAETSDDEDGEPEDADESDEAEEDLDETPETASDDDQDDEDETDTDEAPVQRDHKPANSTARSAPETTEGSAPDARCAARGCPESVGEVRSNTPSEHACLCSGHRQRARLLMRSTPCDAAGAVARLRAEEHAPCSRAPRTSSAGSAKASDRCPVPGCGQESAPTTPRTAEELKDFCTAHRTRARDLIHKVGYSPAEARARAISGKSSKASAKDPPAKTVRPRRAETVRSVPASPLGDRVAVVRRLIACEAGAGGVDAVEQLVALATRCGGAGELVALVDAVLGGAS